jgi:hypothetical protein
VKDQIKKKTYDHACDERDSTDHKGFENKIPELHFDLH